ncbi:hypothetical protein V6N13_053435 [Hibiscus sabdariffa]
MCDASEGMACTLLKRCTSKTITLSVCNIPLVLHWSGLKQVFGRYGDITDQFIASKLDIADVGREVFLVQDHELGFNLLSKQNPNPPQVIKNVEFIKESSLDSSFDSIQPTAQINETHLNCHEENEVANAICMGKESSINEG